MGIATKILGPAAFDEVAVVGSVLGKAGTLVDVGAHFGASTLPFARKGWGVWAFEPDPTNRARLEAAVIGYPNVHVDPRAVDEVGDIELALFTSSVSTGISSLTPFHPSHQATSRVTTVRLDQFLADHQVGDVTFLKTDTEGHDLQALRTFPWDRFHPRAVVCEFEDRKTKPLGYDFHELGRWLMDLGFDVLVSEWYPIVDYGMRHRWRGVRRYPSELVDPAGWGNFIAVEPALAWPAFKAARNAGQRLRVRLAVERAIDRG